MSSLKRILCDPYETVRLLGALGYLRWIPDEPYLRMMYRVRIGKKLHLDNPKTYNEKIQWLKLYDRNPIYIKMVDKYLARLFVAERIGNEYLIPLVGVWEDPYEIDFDVLPEKFVLKCNHDSGTVYICKNKDKFDISSTLKLLKSKIKRNFYQGGREWPYKNVKPKIICEKYMEDNNKGKGLTDYKIFCFGGVPKLILVVTNRFGDKPTHYDFFDQDYNWLDLERGHPRSDYPPCKPVEFKKMLEIAKKLSAGIPHVRVDLYNVNGKIYFGELTLFPGSGFIKNSPPRWDYIMGNWIELPKKQF